MLKIILLILLGIIVIGAFPSWPHSKNYGYYPSGIGGVLLIALIVLVLSGRI